jgi:YD repeat-containing protein
MRTITGVGSFTLNYAYNLSGQLSSITDPFGAQVGYSHDKVGRVSAITGSNFASVSSYASGLQYRAWGALKALTYGNSKTVALGYNVNQDVSSFEIPGLMKKNYQYYDDGRLKFTQDELILNSKFDRLYEYDHVGRITSALSGAEARGGGPTNDRPYNETLAYDAMGHLTLREVRNWDRFDTTGNETYINNRHQFWQYDADGRLLAGTDGTYTYDAAGQISMFGDVGYETDQQLDGDGQRIKSVQRRYDNEADQWVVDKTTYYIHSSVIGQVISEVSPQGTKERSFVFAGEQVIAIQSAVGGQSVTWKHYDPSNASSRSTDSSGTSVEAAEMDPMGANAGLMKPFTWPPPTSSGKLQPYYGVPDLNTAYQGCELSGIPAPCSVVMSSTGNSVLGYWFGGPEGPGTPFYPADWHPDFVGWLVIKQRQLTSDNFMSLGQEWLMSYQDERKRLTDAQIAQLLSNLQKYLGDPDCAKYIQTMLGSLPDTVAFTSKFTGSLEDVFNRIKDGGGFWSGNTMAAKSPGLADTNPNTMTTTFDNGKIAPGIMGESWEQHGATNTTIHELTHVFTNSPNAGVYGHLQMAKAASGAGSALGLFGKDRLDLEFPDPTKLSGKEYDLALSEYFNRTLSYACR